MAKKHLRASSTLLLLFALASCNGQPASSKQSDSASSEVTSQSISQSESKEQPTSQSSEIESSSQASDPVTSGWSEEAKAKIEAALHGTLIPYADIDVTIELKDDNKAVKMKGTGPVADGFLSEYAAKYTPADGWEGGAMDEDEPVPTGAIYGFRKKVTTKEGDRFIVIAFGARDASGNLDKKGTFYLEGSDPYQYAFPSEFIADYLEKTYQSKIVPPAFEAEFYGMDQEGVLACHNATEESEATYHAALLMTGQYRLSSEKDANGRYRAYPADDAYTLLYHFSEGEGTFYLMVGPHLGWNAKAIEAFFRKYNATPFEIPAMEGDYFGFRFTVTGDAEPGKETAQIILTDCMPTSAEGYLRELGQAGYAVPEGIVFAEEKATTAKATLLTDEGVVSLALDYDGAAHTLLIGLSNDRDSSKKKIWPAAELSRDIALAQDSIPAFAGANLGFGYDANEGKPVVTVYINDLDAQELKQGYIAQLEDLGYVALDGQQDQPRYRSLNNEVIVTVAYDSNEPGLIRLYFQRFAA